MPLYSRPSALFGIALSIFLFVPERSRAEWAPRIGGRVYTDQYIFSQGARSGTLEQSSLSAWLDFEATEDSGFGVRVIAQGDGFARSILNPDQTSGTFRVREAYGSWLSSGLEIKVGQQIIPWGKSDGVNPTDYFTAKNFTLLNPDDEVRRLGAPALNLSWTPKNGESPLTFQLVTQSDYPTTELLIPDQSVPAEVTLVRNSPQPLFNWNPEVGARISLLKNSFDFSLSAFRGFAHMPFYRFTPIPPTLSPVQSRETAIGGDGSFTLGSQIIRIETALHMPDNGTSSEPLFGDVQPWHWDSVVGIERPLGSDFRAQFQFLYRWHPYWRSPVSAVGAANALILNFQRRAIPGATFRLAYQRDSSDWSAEVFLIGYFANGQDYLLRPQIGWTPLTNLKFSLGFDWYGGEVTRPLGALRDRSHAFFETRFLF